MTLQNGVTNRYWASTNACDDAATCFAKCDTASIMAIFYFVVFAAAVEHIADPPSSVPSQSSQSRAVY